MSDVDQNAQKRNNWYLLTNQDRCTIFGIQFVFFSSARYRCFLSKVSNLAHSLKNPTTFVFIDTIVRFLISCLSVKCEQYIININIQCSNLRKLLNADSVVQQMIYFILLFTIIIYNEKSVLLVDKIMYLLYH